MAASSNSSSSSSHLSNRSSSPAAPLDPILRNALRYSLSPREYDLLHKHFLSSRAVPRPIRGKAPPPRQYAKSVRSVDDYNASAVRVALRVWVGSYAALKAWDVLSARLWGSGKIPARKTSIWKSPSIRLSTSLSFILLFHRLLHRFFTRLRASLLEDHARAFRRRNPRVSGILTSNLAPPVGASLAGLWLGLYPAAQLRVTMAIYVLSRALEFVYNIGEDAGWWWGDKGRPWWFGSWMLMPPAFGQLLHAFVFDRDCFPSAFGNFIMKNSSTYIQTRPTSFPKDLKWPGTYQIVDSLAEISKMKWPKFVSPILFPSTQALPPSLKAISPIISPAHPSLSNLSCAVLHPHDPSCLRTYLSFYVDAFPSFARFFALIFGAMSLLRIKSIAAEPGPALAQLAKRIIRMSLFVTGAIASSWGSICLFQHVLPARMFATQRWFLGGALGGLWAFLERRGGRSNFLYCTRQSADSLWKVGVKRKWWRGVAGGDVLLFAASLAVVNVVYEVDPKAVNGTMVRKGLGMLRGEGWVDRVGEEDAVVEEREIKQQGVPLDDPSQTKRAVKKEL